MGAIALGSLCAFFAYKFPKENSIIAYDPNGDGVMVMHYSKLSKALTFTGALLAMSRAYSLLNAEKTAQERQPQSTN